MPQVLRIGPYSVYFWSNEGDPLEPVHVHISEGKATPNATKMWITAKGRALLCNNDSKIPERVLRKLLKVVEANSEIIIQAWKEQFDEISYYC